ncbi:Unsaturated glucuronyl hydrolase [Mycovorax composti]|jgi:Glycosyl Hydrolase Family 88.|uniref:Unsaturated glucuronyl hydrolase n=2 Tax=Chitinophagaceae TaxID=563835 RepID=A0ABZ2ENH9_9BACT
MKKISVLLAYVLLITSSIIAQRPAVSRKVFKLFDKSLKESAQQYRFMMQRLEADRFPVSWKEKEDRLTTSGSEPWVGGFYPGGLLYLYEYTGDSILYHEALRKMKILEKEQYNKTTHDLGFMMYCSFGNADRLSPQSSYKEIILNSAASLASRFNEKVGCIRSWDSDPGRFMVIIDNMVNLELLLAATQISGDSSYYKIAVTHANTTLRHHFRPDFSSYHLVIYDPHTGNVQKKQTVQGAFDESAWARGQAWGLYGYTLMYRGTKDVLYLKQAKGIADFLLNHPNLPKDKVPYWDFNAPKIPLEPRDASAGAIIASALIELSGYVDNKDGKRYLKVASEILKTLSSAEYRASIGTNGGFILKHGVGNYPRNADIDVPLIYADYYYIEALTRFMRLKKQ